MIDSVATLNHQSASLPTKRQVHNYYDFQQL